MSKVSKWLHSQFERTRHQVFAWGSRHRMLSFEAADGYRVTAGDTVVLPYSTGHGIGVIVEFTPFPGFHGKYLVRLRDVHVTEPDRGPFASLTVTNMHVHGDYFRSPFFNLPGLRG
jgi:hypothetical protein